MAVARAAHSMTGVGLAAGATEVGEARIEVRTVNGRALAVRTRVSSGGAGFETALEELARQRLQRGSVTIVVELQAAGPQLPDRAALRRVAAELCALAEELGLEPPRLVDVVQLAGGSSRNDATTARPLPPRLLALVQAAIDDLQAHRRREGQATTAAVEQQLAEFTALVQAAAARAPELAAVYRERLLQRVQEFTASHVGAPVPAIDLVREVAIHADRIDVSEELQRLQAHLAAIRAVLDQGGEVGRRLEFLLQELLRETNTLGSKSPDATMAHTAVAMKTCIDRMKEQVANLE